MIGHVYVRCLILAVSLAAAQCAVLRIQRGYTLGEIEPPRRDLRELPRDLGSWRGEDVPADPRLADLLQARVAVDRRYRNPPGHEILVHAVWTDDYVRIHFPEQCFRESGWTQTAAKEISIPVGDTLVLPTRLLTFERDNEQLQVLYWFQIGDRFFFNRWEHRAARQQLCWGRTRWPPLVKVMMDTSAAEPAQAEARLRDMAAQVFAWTQGVDRASAAAARR